MVGALAAGIGHSAASFYCCAVLVPGGIGCVFAGPGSDSRFYPDGLVLSDADLLPRIAVAGSDADGANVQSDICAGARIPDGFSRPTRAECYAACGTVDRGAGAGNSGARIFS